MHKHLWALFQHEAMLSHNILAPLPTWLSRWFGYRSSPPPKRPNYIIWLWSFIGAFSGISVIQAVFGQAHYFVGRKVPTLVASYVSLSSFFHHETCSPLSTGRLSRVDLRCY